MNIFDATIVDSLGVNDSINKLLIYIVDMDRCTQNISQFWELLSISEREKAKRYYTQLLTDRYIISHGLLRSILSYYIKQLPLWLKQFLQIPPNYYLSHFVQMPVLS